MQLIGHNGRRMVTLLMWLILCADVSFGQSVYDFSTSAGVDRFAFGNFIPNAPLLPTDNAISSTRFSAADFAVVATSNHTRNSTDIFGSQVKAAVRFAITIAERPSTITQSDPLWKEGRI